MIVEITKNDRVKIEMPDVKSIYIETENKVIWIHHIHGTGEIRINVEKGEFKTTGSITV